MGKVSIVRTSEGIRQAVSNFLDLIGGLDSFISRRDRVLVKPNLNGVEGCTNLELTESLIRMLLDSGARRVTRRATRCCKRSDCALMRARA